MAATRSSKKTVFVYLALILLCPAITISYAFAVPLQYSHSQGNLEEVVEESFQKVWDKNTRNCEQQGVRCPDTTDSSATASATQFKTDFFTFDLFR